MNVSSILNRLAELPPSSQAWTKHKSVSLDELLLYSTKFQVQLLPYFIDRSTLVSHSKDNLQKVAPMPLAAGKTHPERRNPNQKSLLVLVAGQYCWLIGSTPNGRNVSKNISHCLGGSTSSWKMKPRGRGWIYIQGALEEWRSCEQYATALAWRECSQFPSASVLYLNDTKMTHLRKQFQRWEGAL